MSGAESELSAPVPTYVRICTVHQTTYGGYNPHPEHMWKLCIYLETINGRVVMSRQGCMYVLCGSHSCVHLYLQLYNVRITMLVCFYRQPLPKLPEKNFTHLDVKLRKLREEEKVRRNGLGQQALSAHTYAQCQ